MKEFNLDLISSEIKETKICVLNNNTHSAWLGLGNHIYNLKHVINELLDNAVASLFALKQRFGVKKTGQIHISIRKHGDEFLFRIEDTGVGIDDIANAFSLGGGKKKLNPLNVHGHGMKISLATVDKENKKWIVFSRTAKDVENNEYHIIKAPYSEQLKVVAIDNKQGTWPGKYSGTGTIIQFSCNTSTFHTLQEGVKGSANDITVIGYLIEQLGYVYRNDIEAKNIQIFVEHESDLKKVKPVAPKFRKGRNTGKKVKLLNLPKGIAKVDYIFGEIEKSGFKTIYRHNIKDSGVELRLNGRLILDRLFTEIWGLKRHNSYNAFIGVVNIITDEPNCLPITNTTKNGIDQSDPVFREVLNWIRNSYPQPLKLERKIKSEKDYVLALKEKLNKEIQSKDKCIQTEFQVFKSESQQILVDLYCFDGINATLYEAKKGQAEPINLYQLRMYWDGAVEDGININEGILIAASFCDDLDYLVARINTYLDPCGNNYNFRLQTWKKEGVSLV